MKAGSMPEPFSYRPKNILAQCLQINFTLCEIKLDFVTLFETDPPLKTKFRFKNIEIINFQKDLLSSIWPINFYKIISIAPFARGPLFINSEPGPPQINKILNQINSDAPFNQ